MTKSFRFQQGDWITPNYAVLERLGGGAEGEVYKVREKRTGLTRAAKLFYPSRGTRSRRFIRYAQKLDRLRDCDIVIKFFHADVLDINGSSVDCLFSEYFSGTILEQLINDAPGKRLSTFEALSLIYRLTIGIEEIHARKEFHGDLHMGNIMVTRRGVFFQLRTLDFNEWGRTSSVERRADIISIARLLYDLVGGRPRYGAQPNVIKSVCLGLRSDLIVERFPTIFHLRSHLENFDW